MTPSGQGYFARRLADEGRHLRFRGTGADEARDWQANLRAELWRLLGLDRMRATRPAPRLTESITRNGYRRERIEIDTEPGVTMPLYRLVPDRPLPGSPVVVAPHGHAGGGKLAVAGCGEVAPEVAEAIRAMNYDYGRQAAQRGYTVYCPDARGAGERREPEDAGPDKLIASSCRALAHRGLPLGLTVAGMWVWDLLRLVDYIAAAPETRTSPIVCLGFSGGGLQCLLLAALDSRIRCAVISGYFYGAADALMDMADNCDCNYVPGLWLAADMGDLAGLIAPRPLLIESGTDDPLAGARGLENVREQYAILARAYAAFGATDRLTHDIFSGGHRWNGALVWDWLAQHLR